MHQTFQYKNHTFHIASKVYSDFGAHLPLIRSFSLGNNFNPIENPQFPNQPIKYHYLFFLIVGLMEKIGINIALSLNLLSAFGFGLLLIMIYQISFFLWKSKKISFLSVLLFLFNGSLSFIYFFKENHFFNIIDFFKKIIFNKTFSSFGPWDQKMVSAFWNLNIYTNQRHLALSFGLTFLLIYQILIFIKAKNKKSKKLNFFSFSSFLILLMPFLNQATYAIYLINVFFLILFNKKVFLNKKNLKIKIIYFINLVLSFLFFLNLEKSGYRPIFQIGFLSQNSNFLTILKYWIFNLGIYLPLWFFSMFYFRKNKFALQLIIINSILFIIANTLQLSPDIINNHKLINFFIIILNIAIAKIIFDLFKFKKTKNKVIQIIKNIAVIFLLITMTFSGFLDFFPIFNDNFIKINDYHNSHIATYLKNQTRKNSIFLTTNQLYNPASLVGRKIFIDYGYYSWSYGYQTQKRQEVIKKIFNENSKEALCLQILNNQIDYLLISPNNKNNDGLIFQIKPEFISKENFVLINLNKYCL